jgi:hypothetical protein
LKPELERKYSPPNRLFAPKILDKKPAFEMMCLKHHHARRTAASGIASNISNGRVLDRKPTSVS